MAYKFSYQRILDVRQIQEDQKSSEVASAQNELNNELDELSKLEAKKFSVLNDEEHLTDNTLELMRQNSYVNQVNENIEKQRVRIEKKEKNLNSKQDELLEASKSRKIMDKLKKSDLEKYNIDQNRKEQNQIDEIGANIALKNRRNNS
jgi:flagellar protein FliJ